MNEPLHPAQLRAFEKLKGLRVGALYIDRQEGKLRTVLELVRYRLERDRIDGVLWLCTRRRVDLLQSGILRHAPDLAPIIHLVGIECLSHNLKLFLQLMRQAEQERLMLVIDNGLLIKNGAALRTQRVLSLSERCPYRLLVSDVPFTRSVSDMFTQWYALDWRILGYSSYWGFSVNHLDGRRRGRNMDYLVRAIEPYCAQVLREDVQPAAGRREYVWKFELPSDARAEYNRVVDAFLWRAQFSTTGVYRMLQACQHVACGRRVVREYPLATEPLYADVGDDPRALALLEVLSRIGGRRTLILYRYAYERENIRIALKTFYGDESVSAYPETAPRRFTLMNVFSDERETARLGADVIVYYSSDWNWRKRQEKERQCQGALGEGTLTVVSLVAADTVDLHVLRSVWAKDNLIAHLRRELAQRVGIMEKK